MIRSRRAFFRVWSPLLLAVLAVVSCCIAFVVWRDESHVASQAGLSSDAPTYLSGVTGVNLAEAELAAPDFPERLEVLVESGFRWLRFTLPWDAMEPTREAFVWEKWDAVFSLLGDFEGVQPVVVLDRSPSWARQANDRQNAFAPPHERSDFGAFCAAVAQRYGDQVRYYQVWNEPNIHPHWGERAANAGDYLGLLRECALQIRQNDADSAIVLAALAPTVETGGANLSDIGYLEALYASGGDPFFDVVAIQPYGFAEPPDANADPDRLNFARSLLLREVMVRYGDRSKPLWAANFGWAIAPEGSVPENEWGNLSAEAQASYTATALRLVRSDWPWLGLLFWPATPAGSDEGAPLFALCGADRTPTPTWDVLAAATSPAKFLAPGVHAMDHPAITYGPGWRIADGSADPSADGDRLSFRFHGAGVSIRVRGGTFWSYATVSVDGEPAPMLPRDERGEGYLVLYDPLMETRDVSLAAGLPVGLHEVQLTMTGGWGQWPLLGIEVDNSSPPSTWRWWAFAAAFATLGAAGTSWPSRRRIVAAVASLACPAPSSPGVAQWAVTAICAVALAVANGGLPALAALGVVIAVSVRCPVLLVAAAAAMAPFIVKPLHFGGWQFSAYELLVWSGAFVRLGCFCLHSKDQHDGIRSWLARCWKRADVRGLDWPVLAFVLAGLIATLAARRFGVAANEFRVVFLTGALFFWLVSRLPARRDLFAVWGAFLAGASAVAALGLWQLATGTGRIDVEGVWRVRALYGSPNNLALLLVRAVPVALGITLYGALDRGWKKWLGGGITTLLLAGCLATFSKGAFLLGLPAGIGCVLVLGALRTRRRWPWVTLAVLAVLAAVSLVLLFRTTRFADLVNLREGTTFIRLRLWQSALAMGLDHPWFGVGPDNFLYAYRTVYVLPSAWEELNLSHPHNLLLDFWTRLGLVGTVVGAWIIYAVARRLVLEVMGGDAGAPGMRWALALGMTGALAGTLAHGLIDNSLFLVDLMAVFMLTAASLERLRRNRSQSSGFAVSHQGGGIEEA